MAVDTPAIREVVERVFARQDVLNACKRRDLSTMITILARMDHPDPNRCAHGQNNAGTLERVQDAQAAPRLWRRSKSSLMAWGCLQRRGLHWGFASEAC